MPKIRDYSLYLVISEEYGLGKSASEITKEAISGGVDIIQMREKNKDRKDLVRIACELSNICQASRVTFIVNDDPEIAKESGAGGVHLGQEDLKKYSISKAREIIGEDKIVGISTHSLAELEEASNSDVDYIAYGPVFPTKTKDYFLGTADIKKAINTARKPLVFIGGINLSNLDELLRLGARNIAVIRGIIQERDIASTARAFKNKMAKA